MSVAPVPPAAAPVPDVSAAGCRLGGVIVIAKEPVAGRVKTRLVPPLTHEQAALVAAAALRDTLFAVEQVGAAEQVLALDGSGEGWRPDGWRITPQPEGGLDVRLVSAFAAAPDAPTVLVGMDTPQVTPEQLLAFDPEHYDACLGLAADGGYWAIGFTDPRQAPAAITGVPMSTAHTGADQFECLVRLGMRVQLLDVLHDVDTIDTAERVAALVPESRFAAALRKTKEGKP